MTFALPPELHISAATWREHRRIPVVLPAKLETAPGCLDAVILDISLGGARGWVNRPIGLQEQAILTLERFGSFPAEILCVTRQRNKRFEFRLQFKLDPRTILQRLSGYLSCPQDKLYGRTAVDEEAERLRQTEGLPGQVRVH